MRLLRGLKRTITPTLACGSSVEIRVRRDGGILLCERGSLAALSSSVRAKAVSTVVWTLIADVVCVNTDSKMAKMMIRCAVMKYLRVSYMIPY